MIPKLYTHGVRYVHPFGRFFSTKTLPSDSNQALGIGHYAIQFIKSPDDVVDQSVYEKIKLFHSDATLCGLSALAYQTNAPTIFQKEATHYPDPNGACVYGSTQKVATEKAVVANSSAMREWDSNGTLFGYNPNLKNHQAGEFGHNDFYPVAIAAAQSNQKMNGKQALKGMICIDEIRGRLAEVFSLKTYKIDHVLHGAVASAAVYGAMMGATAEQIESAIGMVIAHYIPFRAIRAGKQLSDSKGASAAISTEMAILSMKRAMNGFQGPKDIFRNPEAIFCLNTKPEKGHSPFNIVLSEGGDDFAVMGMHFKLGLYEHQSAAAIEGIIQLISKHPEICQKSAQILEVLITAYEPAFGIIGDPNKRTPTTRQSADHSMVYIISKLLQKAFTQKENLPKIPDELWKELMLLPEDYSQASIFDTHTKSLMEKVHFQHGGPQYDELYPDGIPTTVDIKFNDGTKFTSGLIMYPTGHARNTTADLMGILNKKFDVMANVSLDPSEAKTFLTKLENIEMASNHDLQTIYSYNNLKKLPSVD